MEGFVSILGSLVSVTCPWDVFPPHLHERIGVGFLSCLHWLLGFVNRVVAEKRGTRKEHIK